MSATFACPHCAALYPFKQVLVGKPVRCSKCKKAFLLRDNGIADTVEEEAPLRPEALETSEHPTATSPVAPSPQRKLNQKQEDARRAMANTLATAAAALQTQSSHHLAVNEGKGNAIRPVPRTGQSSSGKARGRGPIAFVGEGQRSAQNNRLLMVGASFIVACILALAFLCSHHSAQRRTLDAFVAPVEGTVERHPDRLQRMQARAWLLGIPALTDLGHVRVGSTAHYDLKAIKAIVDSTIRKQSYVHEFGLWIANADLNMIQKIWQTSKKLSEKIQALREGGVSVTTREDLEEALGSAPEPRITTGTLASDGNSVVVRLLFDGHELSQGDAHRIANGELPDAIDIAPFSGRNGVSLNEIGSKYVCKSTDYSGQLVRFVGKGWTGEWRVFALDCFPP